MQLTKKKLDGRNISRTFETIVEWKVYEFPVEMRNSNAKFQRRVYLVFRY